MNHRLSCYECHNNPNHYQIHSRKYAINILYAFFHSTVPRRVDPVIIPWNRTVFGAEFGDYNSRRRTATIGTRHCKSRSGWSHTDIRIMGAGSVEKWPNYILCSADQRIQSRHLPHIQGSDFANSTAQFNSCVFLCTPLFLYCTFIVQIVDDFCLYSFCSHRKKMIKCPSVL